MSLYTLHLDERAPSEPELVVHRFSWGAFLLGPLWLASRRLWFAAAGLLVFDFTVAAMVRVRALAPGSGLLLIAIAAALAGLEAREWVRRALARQGRPIVGLAVGRNETEALLHSGRSALLCPESGP